MMHGKTIVNKINESIKSDEMDYVNEMHANPLAYLLVACVAIASLAISVQVTFFVDHPDYWLGFGFFLNFALGVGSAFWQKRAGRVSHTVHLPPLLLFLLLVYFFISNNIVILMMMVLVCLRLIFYVRISKILDR